MRREQIFDGERKKLELVNEVELFGPFNLFSKLYQLIDASSGNNIELRESQIIRLTENIEHSIDKYLLQLNPNSLRLGHEDIFWNLIYLFTNDGINYKFICPYESRIPEKQNYQNRIEYFNKIETPEEYEYIIH